MPQKVFVVADEEEARREALRGKHLTLASENEHLSGVKKKEGDIEIEDYDEINWTSLIHLAVF